MVTWSDSRATYVGPMVIVIVEYWPAMLSPKTIRPPTTMSSLYRTMSARVSVSHIDRRLPPLDMSLMSRMLAYSPTGGGMGLM